MEVTMAEPGEILPERNVDMTTLYDMLRQSKASAEEIVAKMLAIKKEAQPKSQLRELVTQTLLNFVTLRQANRSILLEEDRVKAETERAKAPVDLTTLQLHNLMYEKNHYVKAIKACKDFKTKYPDIELVPEDEFFKDAPEEIKSSIFLNWLLLLISLVVVPVHVCSNAQTEVADASRKELCALREKLELQKKALQETIANRKKFLTSLPSHLKALKKASLPVQHQLGVLHTKKLKQHQLAELLPPPLYVIYSQLLAQKEAFAENIELEITGSVKDAQAFARQLANKDSGNQAYPCSRFRFLSTSLENSKIEDDVPDEEDDGQRRRKRPKKVPSKENLEQSGIYQSHPLKVTLHVNDDEASDLNSAKLITLKFEFLIKLNVVCVGVEGSEEPSQNNILCNLFPNDTGLELPQQSAKLRIGNSLSFDERRTSRPYKWAQHLAGIDVLPEVSPLVSASEESNSETTKHASVASGLSLYRQQNRVQTVVQRIRNRKKAQLALAELLDSLRNLKWPTLTCESVPWASYAPKCNLHGWLSMTTAAGNSTTSLPVSEVEQSQGPVSVDADIKNGVSREDMETSKEDGELPSLAATGVNDVNKLTPSKGSELEHSGRLSLISKSIISPITKGKSPSFKKLEDDVDLMLESENELDEPIQVEETSDNASPAMIENSWADSGIEEYSLVLIRKLDNDERIMKLEAKVKPIVAFTLFMLTLSSTYINVHLIRMIPFDQENLVLGHQVLCLAMLFDFFLDDGNPSSERSCTSVIDVGLCKPVSGGLVTRSFRGRLRMMSRYGLGFLGASPLVIICCLLLRSRPVLRDGEFWLEQGCAFRNYLDSVETDSFTERMESSDSDSLFDNDYNMESESSTEDYVIWEKNVDHIIESDLGVETGNIRNGFSEGEFDSSGEEDVNQDDNNFDESKISDSDEDVVDPDAIGTGDRNDVQSDGHNSIPFMPIGHRARPPILPPTPLVHSQDDMGCLDFHLSHTRSNIQMGVNLPYRPGPSPFQQLQMSNNVSTIMGFQIIVCIFNLVNPAQ
ncbi:hypothetical protein DH2020_008180 [Rehmannia glutinosa]|uniref:Uncharacterized protein n=1 Tax=Rehmannia glutinosa TaxID=99300 RepID=A0ABR0U081_REHGL